MIVIVDNGQGAEEISRFLKTKNEIMNPKDAKKTKPLGFILSDGDPKNMTANLDILEKAKVPVLGIGAGGLFIGAAFGAEVAEIKPSATVNIGLFHGSIAPASSSIRAI